MKTQEQTRLCRLNNFSDSLEKFKAYDIRKTYEYTRKQNYQQYGIDVGLITNPKDDIIQYAFESAMNKYVIFFKEQFGDIKNSDDDIYKAIDIALLYDFVSFFEEENDKNYMNAGTFFGKILKEHIGDKKEFDIIDETLNLVRLKYKDFLNEKEKEFNSLSNYKKEKFDDNPVLYAEEELRKKVSLIPYHPATLEPYKCPEAHNNNGLFLADKIEVIQTYLQKFISSELSINRLDLYSCFIFLPNEANAFKAKYLLDELEYKTKLYTDPKTCEVIIVCVRDEENMDFALEIADDCCFNEFEPSLVQNSTSKQTNKRTMK